MSPTVPELDRAAARTTHDPDLMAQHDEQAIALVLREHGKREGAALSAYEKLTTECDDPGIRYLATMILEDERRHHRLIEEMLHQIESFLWDVEVEPKVPYLRRRVDPELREATDELLALEREDADELRRLRRQVRSQPSSSLLPLLVDLMVHDTAKHIEILKVIRAHTAKR